MADDRITSALLQEAQSKKNRTSLLSLAGDGRVSTPQEWYQIYDLYYNNNGLYDMLASFLRVNGLWMQGMKPLRNPAHRAVEFHVAHLWPGALPNAMPLTVKRPGVATAIQQIWDWSNWGTEKQLTARRYANLGDLFVKVPTHKGAANTVSQVFLQVLDAANVVDFRKDARSFLTYIRIDTHQQRRTEAGSEAITRTEVWDKPSGTFRIYEHTKGKGAALKDLGEPIVTKNIQEAFGFDFIPIVHAKFCDLGEERGANCYVHALDKVDEANMAATRLHQLLFRYNKPTTVLMANSVDDSGRPLPAPTIEDRDGNENESSPAKIGDDDLWELPGYSELKHLVPDLKYADALAILNAQMTELESDLPEILYYQLKENADMSGKALQTLLSGAVDRALEARGNAEWALINAQRMALTIGQLHNLPGFDTATIGTYEAGDFIHSFQERDVIPLSKKERADTVKAYIDTGLSLEFALKQNGFSEDEIADNQKLLEEQKKQEQQLLGTIVLDAMRGRDQGLEAGSIPTTPATDAATIADTAMNGAQVTSLVSIIAQVAANQLPAEAAVELIHSAFPALDMENIRKMVNSAVSFEPSTPVKPAIPVQTTPSKGA